MTSNLGTTLPSIVGTVATAVVGLAGVAATYRAGKRQANVTLVLAREERHQQRIQDAYGALAKWSITIAKWTSEVSNLTDLSDTGIAEKDFDAPRPINVIEEAGASTVFWSKRVEQIATDLQNEIIYSQEWAAWLLKAAKNEENSANAPKVVQQARNNLFSSVARLSALQRELLSTIRKELTNI